MQLLRGYWSVLSELVATFGRKHATVVDAWNTVARTYDINVEPLPISTLRADPVASRGERMAGWDAADTDILAASNIGVVAFSTRT